MITLSTRGYYLKGVSEDFFWRELNKITVGGADPEFLGFPTSTTTENSKKTFYGRRVDNKFSISLNQNIAEFARAGVVAKGIVCSKGCGLMIHCRFEYPVLSLFLVTTFATYVFVRFLPLMWISCFLFALILTTLYLLMIQRSHSKIKIELADHLTSMEEKAKTASTKMHYL